MEKKTGIIKSIKFKISVLCLFLFASSAHAIPTGPQFNGEDKHGAAIDLLKKNEYDKVIQFEKGILSGDPKDLTAYYILSIAYLGKDDEKNARAQAEKVKNMDSVFASEIYGSMGRFYITKQRYHKSLVYLQESLKIKEDPETIKNIASIYLGQGLLKNAKEYYEKLPASSPDNVNLSRIYLAEGDYTKAIEYAKKAVKEDLKASGGYLVLGTGYLLTGETELAKINFRVLKELNPEFFLAHYFAGLIHMTEKNYDEALIDFKNLTAAAPKLKEGYLNAASIYHLKGNLEKAKEAAAKAIELDPLDPAGHLALGNIYISEKDFKKSDSEYQKAGDMFLEPNVPGFSTEKYFKDDGIDAPAYLTLAVLYNRAGLFNEAIKTIDAASKKPPLENPFLTVVRARAELKAGGREKAERLLNGLKASNPELITPAADLGDILEAKGEIKAAIETYAGIQRSAVGISRINLKLADLYKKTDDIKAAIDECKKAMSLAPENTAAYKKAAVILAGKDRLKEALAYASKGNSINPEDAELKDTLGWINYRLGNYDSALKAYTGIIKSGTNNPEVYYHLGLVYQKLEKKDDAIDSFEKALNINDEFSGAAEAKNILKKLSGLG